MRCKSCGSSQVVHKNFCTPCLSDYRYNIYRKNLHKRQLRAKQFFSAEGKRWRKSDMKLARLEIKHALINGSHKEIRRHKIEEVFSVSRSFANKILQELMREGRIIKHGNSTNTYYVIVKALD